MINVNKFIDSYNETGKLIWDEFFIPIIKGGKNIFIDDNKFIKSMIILRAESIKNKMFQYIEFIDEKEDENIVDFINNLKKEEETFFIETINKVIDLDDSLQIYIMAFLTKQFKENNELNYYEKQLYYNISSLSEDDFKIFYCLFKKKISENKNYIYLYDTYIQKEVIEISLKKFTSFGLLKENTPKNFYDTQYSIKLYDCLNSYFKNLSCDKLLEIEKNQITDGIRLF